MESSLDRSTFKAFENAAAGHEGILSDATGALFIKPSTKQEQGFYETSRQLHPELAECMPTYMGTLTLDAAPDSSTDDSSLPLQNSDGATDAVAQTSIPAAPRLYGRKISSDVAIVLENFEHGFVRANVMDLKLGSKLYAPGTNEEKAARLDKVASETTSGSLDFRIAGMRVWSGREWKTFDKFYGRQFTAENVDEGFATFFKPLIDGLEMEYALRMLDTIFEEIKGIRQVLSTLETRMYGASVLVIYEGDLDVLKSLMVAVESYSDKDKAEDHDESRPGHQPAETVDESAIHSITLNRGSSNGGDDDDDDDSEDETPRHAYKVGLVDFAHASFVPGGGRDERVIHGLSNIESQLDKLMMRLR